MDNPKTYKKGSKDSSKKKPTLILLKNNHLEFMDTFIKYKMEQGFHRLAYTRADLIEEALKDFIIKEEKNFEKNASDSLKSDAEAKKIFSHLK